MPDNGIVSVQSRFSASETMARLLAALAERNLTVFARVDHAAGAASVVAPRSRAVRRARCPRLAASRCSTDLLVTRCTDHGGAPRRKELPSPADQPPRGEGARRGAEDTGWSGWARGRSGDLFFFG